MIESSHAGVRPHLKRWGWRVLPAAVLLTLLVLGRLVADPATQAPLSAERDPVMVSAIKVGAQVLPTRLRATGELIALKEVQLAPQAAGRVAAIRFASGDFAKRGQVLVTLDAGPERADRAAAASKVRLARIRRDRSKALAGTGAEPTELLQQHQAELEQALAEVAQWDARIAEKVVRAPFSGHLGLRLIDPGEYLKPGDPVASLASFEQLHVNFHLPQQDLAKLGIGQEVIVRSDAFPAQEFTGRINAIEPIVRRDTRNVLVQATIENFGGVLRPGLFVTVDVVQPPLAGAIMIPETAVQTSASGNGVYLIQSSKARFKPVTLGERLDGKVQVSSGVASGDVVITSGFLRLQPDVPVEWDRRDGGAK